MSFIRYNSSDKQILIYLSLFISDIHICKDILSLKKKLEYNDTLNYHLDNYNKITKEFLFLINNQEDKFSFIHDDKNYVVKPDFKLDFFNYTGISYQTIHLIHNLIIEYKKFWLSWAVDNPVLIRKYYHYVDESELWGKHTDYLFTILSKKIKESMIKIM
tara:strand:+ start:1370 stop:1849 length:480 start_codon:yes stop_codon:yes gene_type:complete